MLPFVMPSKPISDSSELFVFDLVVQFLRENMRFSECGWPQVPKRLDLGKKTQIRNVICVQMDLENFGFLYRSGC